MSCCFGCRETWRKQSVGGCRCGGTLRRSIRRERSYWCVPWDGRRCTVILGVVQNVFNLFYNNDKQHEGHTYQAHGSLQLALRSQHALFEKPSSVRAFSFGCGVMPSQFFGGSEFDADHHIVGKKFIQIESTRSLDKQPLRNGFVTPHTPKFPSPYREPVLPVPSGFRIPSLERGEMSPGWGSAGSPSGRGTSGASQPSGAAIVIAASVWCHVESLDFAFFRFITCTRS